MELDMYGDPVKDCCVKNCKASAVIIEKGKSYCPDHYAEKVLKMSLTAVSRFIAEKENTNEFA